MRSASFRNAIAIGFALAAAMSAGAQINPDTQIRWPPCYGAATLYDIVTNTCVVGNAPGSSLELQHNGTDLPVQSLLNFLDTPPGMPSGYQPVNWGNDSGGGIGGWVPPVSNSFTMFPGPPISGQYALIYPSSCGFTANPGNSSMSGSCSGGAGSMNAQNISGLNPASGYLSYIFTLPAGISQANITAVYAAGVYSIASAGDQYLEVPSCTDGTTSVYFFGASVSQLPLTGTSVLFSSVPTVSSVSCKLDAEGSSYIYPGTGGYLAAGGGFALYVYYTGTPIATPPTQVSVWSPLQIHNGNFTLAVPYNVGYDWSNTNSYNVTIPAFLAPGNSITPGSEIVLEVSNSNTSTTVTVNANGTVRPVRLKDSVTLPAVGDIAGNVGGGIGPPAVLILDGGGFYWDLQNPQVSGGSLASALTGAASSGASPGSTYNGSAAVTFDYHTFGAAGLAASNTFSGATTNDYSGTSQFKLPVAAGYAAAAQGECGYDSTGKNWHCWVNGADTLMIPLASGFVSGDCAEPTESSGSWSLVDVGGACGVSGGGSAFSAITSGSNTTATMTVGSGGSMGTSGTGTIAATSVTTKAGLPSGIFSCTEVWSGSGTSSALVSGDDAISNNTCYNDSGSTRTITAVKCRSDNGSNTTTVNPTFGSAGTGTTILSGALTCGNSYAYSSSGTVSNASWTTGAGIDPGMATSSLTGTSISMIVEYHY